jgi:hypothetical protein
MQATSIYGMFQAGTVQMRGKSNAFFAATSQPLHVYALGGNSSVVSLSVVSSPPEYITSCCYQDFDLQHDTSNVVLLSQALPSSATGLQFIRRGAFTGSTDVWTGAWSASNPTSGATSGASTWNSTLKIGFNNRNFPVLTLSNASTLPEDDAEALLTGVI